MHKPTLLLAACCCILVSYAQKLDSLIIFYKTDAFTISKQDKQKLDSFLVKEWDRIFINGYTDETDDIDYNLELSKKRSGAVHEYIKSKNFPMTSLFSNYFGESKPTAANDSETGRAMNRRTVIIGQRYPRVSRKPVTDLMKPVTTTLDNGFIITYRPGALPEDMANRFAEGSGSGFKVITNTLEMRQNNLFNNTTNGEILSSVLIFCNNGFDPCKLDSAIAIKVPIPFKTKCPISKVKFFNAVAEKGKMIWQEQTKLLYPEEINGVQYIQVWMDNLCGCINFDFKIDPDCFETDSTRILYTNATIKNLSAELKDMNSVYMPRKINDTTHSLLFVKDKLDDASISFALYNGKRRVKSFKDEPLDAFPYDDANASYKLSTGQFKFHFPKQNVWDVVLKVNNDRYRAFVEHNKCELIYLNRSTEKILVDFWIMESKKRIVHHLNIPIGSLPYDPATGYFVIDKKFLKAYKQAATIAKK